MRDISLMPRITAAAGEAVLLSFSVFISGAAAQSLPGKDAAQSLALSTPSGRSEMATLSRSSCSDLLEDCAGKRQQEPDMIEPVKCLVIFQLTNPALSRSVIE
mgnify:CR=1 FL=1